MPRGGLLRQYSRARLAMLKVSWRTNIGRYPAKILATRSLTKSPEHLPRASWDPETEEGVRFVLSLARVDSHFNMAASQPMDDRSDRNRRIIGGDDRASRRLGPSESSTL